MFCFCFFVFGFGFFFLVIGLVKVGWCINGEFKKMGGGGGGMWVWCAH